MPKMTNLAGGGVALCAASLFAPAANALFIDLASNQLISEGGEVSLRFDGRTAAHSTDVLTESGEFIFNNQSANFGDTFDLGVIAAGETISFRFDNLTSGMTFFSGLGALNPDGIIHVLLSLNSDNSATVALEDLFRGGDKDFDDAVFTVSEAPASVVAPAPGAAVLLLSGLLGLGFAYGRRKHS